MKSFQSSSHRKDAGLSIAMFTPTSYGGHARYTSDVLKALVALGGPFQYRLLTRSNLNPEFETDEYKIDKVLPVLRMREDFANPIYWIASRAWHYLRRAYVLLQWVCNEPALKIIHFQEVNTYFDLLPLWILKNVLGLKLVMTVHNVVPHSYAKTIPKWFVDLINRLIFQQMEHLFVHSVELAAQLTGKYPISPAKVTVVPIGVSQVDLNQATAPQLQEGTVLFFGEIRRNKGLHNLLAAANNSHRIKKIVVAGRTDDAPYYQELLNSMELVRRRGIEVEVIKGYIPEADVASIFGRVQLVALLYENYAAQSGILFDAIAYQRPVIATPVGALGNLVQQTGIGTIADSMEPQRMAQRIDETLALAQSGHYQIALTKARNRYSWQQQAILLQQCYQNLLGISPNSHAGKQ